ncbi:MAG: hypothetical protein MJ105_08415 [Lachnospiraceae bacterium]|nr:hypothetical protein [Lachnospiraceae bacterium]
MATVTGRIKEITQMQPRGGFLPVKEFEKIELPIEEELHEIEQENIIGGLVGMAVDYLTRYMNGATVDEAFQISLLGAKLGGFEKQARFFADNITGLDERSIDSACKLVGYDCIYRVGPKAYKPVVGIIPNDETIDNIRIMVRRSIEFIKQYGPITKDGFTFEGGYTSVVSAGDGDFLTKDTLWDFKVVKGNLTKDHTLQILMYYLMGKRSKKDEFVDIDKIGIYNPRKNVIYIKKVDEINKRVIETIEHEVIGYDNEELNAEFEKKEKEAMETIRKVIKKANKKKKQDNIAKIIGGIFTIVIIITVIYFAYQWMNV